MKSKCFIPRFPDSWKKFIGQKFFNFMCKWRSAAIKGMSQSKLNENYGVVTDRVQHNHNSKKRKVRCAQQDDDNMDIDDDDTTSSNSVSSNKKLCVRLAKSNDIITEREP